MRTALSVTDTIEGDKCTFLRNSVHLSTRVDFVQILGVRLIGAEDTPKCALLRDDPLAVHPTITAE